MKSRAENMSIQELTYLNIALFVALALIPTVCVHFFPGSMNERLRRSLEGLDQERIGNKERYIIHYRKFGLIDAGALYAFIVFGLVFMNAPAIGAYFTSWDEVSTRFIIIAWISGIIFSFLFPLACYVALLFNTSRFLVVTEDGFEVWKIGRKGVRLLNTNKWDDIRKIRVSNQYQGWDADLMYVYTGNGSVRLLTNWTNMLPFLQDLSSKATDRFRRADEFTKANIEYNIRNPKSEARRAALRDGQVQDKKPKAYKESNKGSRSLVMFGTGYLVFWTAIVLLVSILEIDVPVVLLAIPFLGCIGFIAWGLLRIRRLKKADSIL
jgi:hypothetical protein